MGIFKKDTSDTDEARREVLAQAINLYTQSYENPGLAAASIIARHDEPVAVLAHTIVTLIQAGTLDGGQLAGVGIDAEELSRVDAALQASSTFSELNSRLEVGAAEAIRQKHITEIIADNKLDIAGEALTQFKEKVAEFAHQNKISDLRIAYRLMRAEGNDPMRGIVQRGAGYL